MNLLDNLRAQRRAAEIRPGDRVAVNGLTGTFKVLTYDGALFRLVSERGVELRAGYLAVERAEGGP